MSTLELRHRWGILLESRERAKQENDVEEPIDNVTKQSTGGDETQTDKPTAITQGASREVGSDVEPHSDTTDNTRTSSMLQVENRSSNEEGSKSETVASDAPAASSARAGTPQETSKPTPMSDLTRRKPDGPISIFDLYGGYRGFHYPRIDNEPEYAAPVLPRSLYRSLVLPAHPERFGTARELFNSIVNLLRNHAMLSEKQCSLLAYWSITTWFPDFLPFIPSVVITGPAATADLLLRTLVAVCRRPMLLAELNPAVLRALLLTELVPTLLVRQPQLSKRMVALLDASNQPGYLMCNGKDFQYLYCAKCVYIGESAENQLLKTDSIHIHVGGNSRRCLLPVPKDDVIQDFQNRLFSYRMLFHDDVAQSKFRAPAFQFRAEVSAVAEVLGASIVNDPELQRGVLELLRERDEQSRADRASGLDGTVLKAVLWHCHQPDQKQVFVREIASTANRIYSEDGESLKVSNETVGHVLKSLGLYTRRLGNAGRGLVLDKVTQSHAHELGHANEVLPDSAGLPTCGYCHRMQLLQTEEVV